MGRRLEVDGDYVSDKKGAPNIVVVGRILCTNGVVRPFRDPSAAPASCAVASCAGIGRPRLPAMLCLHNL